MDKGAAGTKIQSTNPNFPGITTVGNLIQYSDLTISEDPILARVISVTSNSISVVGVATVTGVCNGGLPIVGLNSEGESLTGITTAAENVQVTWNVTANGSSAYRFTGPGQSGSDDNPDLYLVRGHRYIFKHNATSSHPIQIRVASGGAAYTDGITYSDTGNNRTTDGNNLIINLQHDAPARLFYQCTAHGSMVGNIYTVGGPQVISGVVTATTFVGNLTGNPTGTLQTAAQPNITSVGTLSSLNVSGNVSVGGTLTYEDVTNIDSVGLITARNGIIISGVTTVSGSIVDNSGTYLHLKTNAGEDMAKFQKDGGAFLYFNNNQKLVTSNTGVTVTGTVAATAFTGDGSGLTNIVGLTTEALTTAGSTVTLDLTKDDHKITKSGTYTVTCTGGSEGSSHSLRIENSGTSSVSFSSYFKFPSGGTPSLPTTNGAISLISFTVHKAGSVGVNRVLLAGASVNYS